MLSFLQRPYPIDKSVPRMLLISVLFGLFVFAFLRFFEPFGISEMPVGKTLICAGFGLWCLLALVMLNIGCVRLFPKVFEESRWTVGKELLWVTLHVALIGLGNACLAVFSGMAHWSPGLFLTYEVYTVAVGIFPITISVLVTELRLNRHYSSESAELNTHLPKGLTAVSHITLPSDNKNENLTIPAASLVYLEAADNYVTVYHNEAGTIRKTVLRSTMKAQEEQLSAIETMFRAHKSYLINCDHIGHVSGNAQGYRLHLQGISDTIPVSRKQNEELRRRLAVK
jgi:DNA-binding LytR/AlgR family response regulator